MTAPNVPGEYEGHWQMEDPTGQSFPATAFVSIVVQLPEADMTAAVELGDWVIKVVEVDRQEDVWRESTQRYAEGVYAVVRLAVSHFGTRPEPLNEYFTFQVHDDQWRVAGLDGTAGHMARWMASQYADERFGIRPDTVDYPVMLVFDVPIDSEELWLDILSSPEGITLASVHLVPLVSKKDEIYDGSFIDAPPLD